METEQIYQQTPGLMYENARKYGLTGTDAMVFEALVYLCKKSGEWKDSFAALARFSCCGDRTTAVRAFGRLLNAGVIVQNAQGSVQIAHETVQNATNSKEERTKEENINNNKSLPAIYKPSDDGRQAGFNLFWKKFNPLPEFNTVATQRPEETDDEKRQNGGGGNRIGNGHVAWSVARNGIRRRTFRDIPLDGTL